MTEQAAIAEPAPSDGTVAPYLVTIGLVGNPNVGKTSVFNRLTNLLAKTSNFGGTTVEHRTGLIRGSQRRQQLVDLPGLYSLQPQSPDEEVACAVLRGELAGFPCLDGILIVVDATNLERSLFVARQARDLQLPMVVAVNMIELARRKGLQIDIRRLQTRLGCPVVPVSARTGEGFAELQGQLESLRALPALNVLTEEPCDSCGSCPYADGHRWAATLARESVYSGHLASRRFTDLVDRIVTQRWLGPMVFLAVMLSVFALVFWLAQFPMELLDAGFGRLAGWLTQVLPAGDLRNLLTEGILAGMGGVLVFLPQICILFFALAILEDSGYLARAVMVVDGWMRRVGLPGQAFVPLLAAHACAIPAIMATKVVENRRDRLVAILVIPLMTCSARLPVYTMISAMLFPQQAWKAAGLFAGAYFLGIVAAFVMAWVFKLSILPGKPSPLILDLPPYRAPSLKNAARQAVDRGWMFVRDAGTVILLISVAIWRSPPTPSSQTNRSRLRSRRLWKWPLWTPRNLNTSGRNWLKSIPSSVAWGNRCNLFFPRSVLIGRPAWAY